jgi:hypothetical protein
MITFIVPIALTMIASPGGRWGVRVVGAEVDGRPVPVMMMEVKISDESVRYELWRQKISRNV